jgi:hypothetical protein
MATAQRKYAVEGPSATNSAAIAIKTDKWTEIMFLALTNQVAYRWKFINFRGKKNRESAGIVDILGVRRDTSDSSKPSDLFEFILVQLKGGSALEPSDDENERLCVVKKHYNAKEVVLFQWDGMNSKRKGKKATPKTRYSVLKRTPEGDLRWDPSTRREIFS